MNQYYEVQINEPIQLLEDAGIISEIVVPQTQQEQQENLDNIIEVARDKDKQEQNIELNSQNLNEQNR